MINSKKVAKIVSVEKRARKKKLQNVILDVAYITGIVSLGVLAPNVLRAIHKLGLIPHKRQRENIRVATKILIEKGFLQIKNGNIVITSKGKSRLARHYKIEKPKRWDNKWRVIVFDIPEKYRYARDNVRVALENVGFIKLQNSVWVFPYNCEEFISLLRSDLEINKNLLYMIVDTLENDGSLKKLFKLT